MLPLACAALCGDNRFVFARLVLCELHNRQSVMQRRRHSKHVGRFVKRAIEDLRAFAFNPIMRACIPRELTEFSTAIASFIRHSSASDAFGKRDPSADRQSPCKRRLALLPSEVAPKKRGVFCASKKDARKLRVCAFLTPDGRQSAHSATAKPYCPPNGGQ